MRGAQSGSSSGRRLSSGRGFSVASGSGEFTPPHPRVPGSGECTPSPPIVVGPSVSAAPSFLAGASTVPEAEDAVSLQEGEEKELKWPPTFQKAFDKTHKKKGMDQYISNRGREVAESYSQQMTEKYVGEEEQPSLDPEGVIWRLEFSLIDKCIHHTWCS
ncbi:hypothetical protein Taro_055181, partial [Colocasia esculenta]|nr:hypothetical protein [Colocasia esculenta]